MTDQRLSTVNIFIFIYAFLLGVFIASFAFISPLVSILIIFIGLFILMADKVKEGKVSKETVFITIMLIALGLGTLRYSVKDYHILTEPDFSGVVVTETELRESSARFVIRADNGEKLLVSTDLFSEVKYGDRVVVEGELERPGVIVPEDGEGRVFDYGKYLSKDDIYFVMYFAKVDVISGGHGNFIKHVLFRIKTSFINKVREILPEPESSLLAGLVVAGKASMPKDILEEFRRAGIIHIVVLSGYNITIIADFIRKTFENLFLRVKSLSFLGPRAAALTSIIGIVSFVLMTGAEATVVRASLMVLVVIAAKLVGRNYSAPRALLGAGLIMVMVNPKILVFDASFQLSFIATSALIYLAPIAEKYLARVPEFLGARSMLATTLATQVAVLPLLVYSMGEISLVSLPANILVLLFIPATMLFGFLATVVAFLSNLLATPLSFITHLLLSWILGVSHYLGNLPFAQVDTPQVSFVVVVVLYILLIILRCYLVSSHSTSSLSYGKNLRRSQTCHLDDSL